MKFLIKFFIHNAKMNGFIFKSIVIFMLHSYMYVKEVSKKFCS